MEERMLELARSGMACSQIMMQLMLDAQGMEDPELVRAMGGLTRGMGRTGHACGALTAGCCIIGLFACQGDTEEPEHPDAQAMLAEYVDYFEKTVGAQYGGCSCADIVHGDFTKSVAVCLPIVQAAMEYLMDQLSRYDVI